jgi:hypothetical protein
MQSFLARSGKQKLAVQSSTDTEVLALVEYVKYTLGS